MCLSKKNVSVNCCNNNKKKLQVDIPTVVCLLNYAAAVFRLLILKVGALNRDYAARFHRCLTLII